MTVTITVESSSGQSRAAATTKSFAKDEISVGRNPGNDVVLAAPDVSGKHAVITMAPEDSGRIKLFVTDIGSSNGTFIEDRKVEAHVQTPFGPRERLVISNFILTVLPTDADGTKEFKATKKEEAKKTSAKKTPPAEAKEARQESASASEIARRRQDPGYEQELRVKATIHDLLLKRLDLRRKDILALGEEGLRERARESVEQILIELRWELPEGLRRDKLIKEILDEALGLGPLETLLADDTVSEVMVNSYDMIYAERAGRLELTEFRYSGESAVLASIERIIAPIGRRIDESSPLVDARLKDGSRVNAVIRPLALNGPCITIRKFSKKPLSIADLVKFGSLSQGMADFLKMAVEHRLNTVISGGTGSGKTTLLNIVACFIPEGQRVITVEDAAELQLNRDHLISFETRPPNLEGKGAITIRDLVRNALRMRPDRIIVGECRGGEALDMLQAMNTGHDGSMTTGHANAPIDMIARLETMVLMGGLDLPIRAVPQQMASAVHLVVQQTRFSCGTRKVTCISEVVGMDPDEGVVVLQDIFRFKQEGFDKDGKTKGSHQATGYIPKFFRKLQERGLPVDAGVFSPGKST